MSLAEASYVGRSVGRFIRFEPQLLSYQSLAGQIGGEGGIRTHGGREPTAVFKTAALNHSATSPLADSTVCDTAHSGRGGPCKFSRLRPFAARRARVIWKGCGEGF